MSLNLSKFARAAIVVVAGLSLVSTPYLSVSSQAARSGTQSTPRGAAPAASRGPAQPAKAAPANAKAAPAKERRIKWGTEFLEQKSGLIYAKGESKPYTGITFDVFESGKLRSEFHYVNGKMNGLGVIYYENGKKAHEATSVDGKVQGTEIEWDENGTKRQETIWFKDGNGHRKIIQWRENGELFQTFEVTSEEK